MSGRRGLVALEVGGDVAELRCDLADVGTGVGSSVGARVQPAPAQEVVFDELDDRVEAERLVVDEAAAGVGADDEGWDPDPVVVLVDVRWSDVVVEATPVRQRPPSACTWTTASAAVSLNRPSCWISASRCAARLVADPSATSGHGRIVAISASGSEPIRRHSKCRNASESASAECRSSQASSSGCIAAVRMLRRSAKKRRGAGVSAPSSSVGSNSWHARSSSSSGERA